MPASRARARSLRAAPLDDEFGVAGRGADDRSYSAPTVPRGAYRIWNAGSQQHPGAAVARLPGSGGGGSFRASTADNSASVKIVGWGLLRAHESEERIL